MDHIFCQPCMNQNKLERAFVWCIICNESLCQNCRDYHKALKITRDHLIVQDHEYRIISKFLSSVKTKCERHPESYILFLCSSHDALCCNLCKENDHSSCLTVNKIEDLTSRDVLYTELKPFLEETNDGIKLVNSICENRNDNIGKLQLQYDQFMDNLKEKKLEAMSALDQLESEIKAKFECGYQFERRKLETERDNAIELQSKLATKLEQLDKIVNIQPLSTVQLFLTNRHLRDQCENEKRLMTEYVDKMVDIVCECKMSVEIGNSNRSIQFTEKMSFTSLKSTFHSNSKTELQTNDYSESKDDVTDSSTIEDDDILPRCKPLMTLENQLPRSAAGDTKQENNALKQVSSRKDVQGRNITPQNCQYSCRTHFLIMRKLSQTKVRCVSHLPNRNIIFGESSNPRLLIYEEGGFKRGEIKLESEPHSITVIDASRIAVTVRKTTIIANFINFKVERKIYLDDNCFGIALLNDTLIVNCENKGLHIIDLADNVTVTVIKTISHIAGVLHLAPVRPDTIVYVNRESKLVNFLNIESTDQHCFECPSLVNATDITSDSNKNIYISCDASNKIYMQTRDSNKWTDIITSRDGIDSPLSIDCSPQGVVYVINNNGKSIYIFQKRTT